MSHDVSVRQTRDLVMNLVSEFSEQVRFHDLLERTVAGVAKDDTCLVVDKRLEMSGQKHKKELLEQIRGSKE